MGRVGSGLRGNRENRATRRVFNLEKGRSKSEE